MAYTLFIIIVVGAIVAVAMLVTRGTRRRGDRTPAPDRTGTEHGGPNIPPYPGEDRPAGPGAEAMGSAEPGNPTPGPEPTSAPAAGEEAAPPSEGSVRGRPDEPGPGGAHRA